METYPFILLLVGVWSLFSCGSSSGSGPDIPSVLPAKASAISPVGAGTSIPSPAAYPNTGSETSSDATGVSAEDKPADAASTAPDSTLSPTPISAAEPPDATASTPLTIPTCLAGKTEIPQIKLVTGAISLALARQSLYYEVSLLDCATGKTLPIKNQTIAYTLDMRIPVRAGIEFEVYEASTITSIKKGTMAALDGDIFGPQPNFYHWESDPLNLITASTKLLVEVTFVNAFEKTTKLQTLTYLRIGVSDVAKTPVAIGE